MNYLYTFYTLRYPYQPSDTDDRVCMGGIMVVGISKIHLKMKGLDCCILAVGLYDDEYMLRKIVEVLVWDSRDNVIPLKRLSGR